MEGNFLLFFLSLLSPSLVTIGVWLIGLAKLGEQAARRSYQIDESRWRSYRSWLVISLPIFQGHCFWVVMFLTSDLTNLQTFIGVLTRMERSQLLLMILQWGTEMTLLIIPHKLSFVFGTFFAYPYLTSNRFAFGTPRAVTAQAQNARLPFVGE